MSGDNAVPIEYGGTTLLIKTGQSLLEGIEEKGLEAPSSCRSGVCQSCMMQAIEGSPPVAAQKGLKPSLREQGYFLACVCYPESSFSCALADDAFTEFRSRVEAIEPLSRDVKRLRIPVPASFEYRAGQFVNVRRADGVIRAYSIANLPQDGDYIELHVRHIPGGLMSEWIHGALSPEDELAIRGPHGDCFYSGDDKDQEIILIGTGTGTAPLSAIACEALDSGHRGRIRFFQGGFNRSRIYFETELRDLERKHSNFAYIQCFLEDGEGNAPTHVRIGNMEDIVTAEVRETAPKTARIYLCGDPQMVIPLRKKLFLSGFSLRNIHSDAFISPPAKIKTEGLLTV